MRKLLLLVSLLGFLAAACSTVGTQANPTSAPVAKASAAPDEAALGKTHVYPYPLGTRDTFEQEQHLVSSYSGGREKLFPHHLVKKGPAADPLSTAGSPMIFW